MKFKPKVQFRFGSLSSTLGRSLLVPYFAPCWVLCLMEFARVSSLKWILGFLSWYQCGCSWITQGVRCICTPNYLGLLLSYPGSYFLLALVLCHQSPRSWIFRTKAFFNKNWVFYLFFFSPPRTSSLIPQKFYSFRASIPSSAAQYVTLKKHISHIQDWFVTFLQPTH